MALFTSKATAVGGRAGHIKSEDGVLDFDIIMRMQKKTEKPAQTLNSSLRQDMLPASGERLSSPPKNKKST